MGEVLDVIVPQRDPPRIQNAVAVMRLEPGEAVIGMTHFLNRLVVATTGRILVEHDDRVMRPLVFEPLGRVG